MPYRWKVSLKGRTSDLQAVQQELRVSDFSLLKEDRDFYLVGKRFEAISTSQEVHATAHETIADINLSFCFARHEFTEISFGDHIEEKVADGSSIAHGYIALGAGVGLEIE